MEIQILQRETALAFMGLTLTSFRQYLFQCEEKNIVAVGASENGIPWGLALATTEKIGDTLAPDWKLLSFFVKEAHRRQGAGSCLWEQLSGQLKAAGCKKLTFQGVLQERKGELLCQFFEKVQGGRAEKLAEVYRFDAENIEKSPFVRGAKAGVFKPPSRFALIPWSALNQQYWDEISENQGNWYPSFVSPLIGKDSINQECTVFAVDEQEKKIAGWITVLNVNGGKDLLYRSFFTREDNRGAQLGFYLLTEAVKRHLDHYMDRGGLSSIPMDNMTALRFSRLFFRDAYGHISYEYKIKLPLIAENEGFLNAWAGITDKKFPCFSNLNLQEYDSLSAFLYETGAGLLPVLHMKNRVQFEDLICKILYGGEKKELPKSMGAMMIKGWKDVFGQAHKVILISDGYYSNLTPEDMNLTPEEWKLKSYQIRLAHEAAHYYALRLYGMMNTDLKDEFIADTMGIITAFQQYNGACFLKFMGLEAYPQYRIGGRLENYLPKGFKEEHPDWLLSEEFNQMKKEAYGMTLNLEAHVKKNHLDFRSDRTREQLLEDLCSESNKRQNELRGQRKLLAAGSLFAHKNAALCID